MANHATPAPDAQPHTLTDAAASMRERANAVDALGQLTETITEATCDEFADFIASWDPVVARAAADWLESVAGRHQQITDPDGWRFCERCAANGAAETVWPCAEVTPALAFAAAYLGGQEGLFGLLDGGAA